MLTSVREIEQMTKKSAVSATTGGFNVNTKTKVKFNPTKQPFVISHKSNDRQKCSINHTGLSSYL